MRLYLLDPKGRTAININYEMDNKWKVKAQCCFIWLVMFNEEVEKDEMRKMCPQLRIKVKSIWGAL